MTNYDTLLAIFAFLTFTAILSPVTQFFRNNLTNGIFIGLLVFITLNTKLDISSLFNVSGIMSMKDSLITIGGVSGAVALFLRARGDDSLYDTLFLGFGIYIVAFISVFSSLDMFSPIRDSFLIYIIFVIGFIAFTLKKLYVSMFFSIKRIGDNF